MEVSSKDPSLIAMDLSKGYASVNSLNCHGHAEARDPLLAKKPEWYHRPPPSCSTEVSSTYWNGSRPSSSYSTRIMDRGIGDTGVIQLHPDMGGGVHRREMEPGPEAIGSYMDTTLAQGLGLYHNGAHGHLWHQRFYECDPVESPVPESSGGEESDSGSDVIFLVSTTKDTLVCSSLSRESVSPVVEPLSPAAALSMDEGRGCYLLPQPLSSPSPDSTYSEVSSDSSADIPVFHARPVVLLPDIRAVCTKMNRIDSHVDVSSDDSDVVEVSVTNERKKVIVFPDSVPSGHNSAAEETLRPLTEREPRRLRRSARIKVAPPTALQFTHSVSPPPQRRHNLRTQNAKRGFYTECYDSDDVIECLERLSSSEEEPVLSTPKPGAAAKSNDSDRADTKSNDSDQADTKSNDSDRADTKSDDSDRADTKSDDSDRADTKSDDSDRADTKSDDSDRDDSDRDTQHSDHLPKTKQNKRKSYPIRECKRFSTKPEPHHGTPEKQHIKVSADSKAPVKKTASTAPVKKTASTTAPVKKTASTAPVKKTASTRRKKRKRHTETGPSCFFPPGELEIELKYANKYKKEKRQNKSDGFYPFVHVEQKVCTVVNYEEQETKVKCNTRQQRTDTTGLTGLVPNTSCFQLGRLCAESSCQPTQFCCLCGRSANARGLGDLHGPYYPIGSSQGCPRHQQSGTEPRLGDVSRRREVDERLHNLANGHAVKMDDTDCEGSDEKPSVVLDGQNGTTAASDECWIHEDCGIWSTGIFLVKGKLYGLCEASSLAQRTVCSICNETGAVMGCFQKGCLQSYHYRCAIESGCVLNEENFSMRCPKHRSAPLTLSVRTQHKR